MAIRYGDDYDPSGDDSGTTDAGGSTPTDTGGSTLTYEFQYFDANGKDVYKGSDGNLYTGDPHGMNGMGPYTPPAASPADTPTGPTGPGNTGTPKGPSGPTDTSWGGPTPTPGPTYQAPGYTKPPAFAYDDFVAPSQDDVLNDKGYQFRLSEGTHALERSAAAKGVLNTGGTLKDLAGYGQNLASQEYDQMYGRKLNEYSTNRQNALQTYNTNYQTQYMDPWSMQYQTSRDQNQFNQHAYDQNQYYGFNTWLQNYNMHRNDKLDDFDMKYKVLGLF